MKRHALFQSLLGTAVLSLCATAGPARAALLYSADFSTYANGDLLKVGTSFDGAPDTFTTKTTNGTFTARSAGNPFGSGNYGEMLAPAASSVTLRQNEIGLFGAGDVRVLSLDVALGATTASPLTFSSVFINASNVSLAALGTINLTNADPIRMTAVYNQSASAIVLPGTLGSLPAGQAVAYYKTQAGVYTMLGSMVAASTGGTGFALAWSSVAINDTSYFDNIGVWSSASDTVGGTSVLALSVGTSPIPEPSALLLGVAGAGLLLRRGQRRA